MQPGQLVLIRHGESVWNKLNQFTGWTDVELTEKGRNEAKCAGQLLKKRKFVFDYCYTSVLKRAIHTSWIILDQLDQFWIPIKKTWRLNERHYGKLQGLNKEAIIETYGSEQVQEWRRSFEAIPPQMEKSKNLNLYYDRRYYDLDYKKIPAAESLKLTLKRLIPFWKKYIISKIQKNQRVLIVAHGNSLRSLVKHVSNLSNDEVYNLHIPTGVPIIYDFNNDQYPIQYSFLKE
ncbi:2,3-diphosphoglycerate-dependent phosphoglycerate mutase [Buchnera aphidicola]|uniref:2,3-diphosphoglycerate-dependent phosphoglycerate mutase n=1 Tax=Buchnera aphidicola TaxID=9 RepID=UPI003463DD1A